jgi:hypothetical protein
MRYQEAIKVAVSRAKKRGEEFFVVYEGDGEYEVANNFDMETWYLGQDPIGVATTDGMYESFRR